MPGVNESFTLLQHSFSPETKQTISKGVVFFPHHLPFVVFYLYDFSFVVVLFGVIFKSFRVVKSKYITHQLQRNARFTKTVFINPVNVLAFSTDGKLQLQHLDQVTLLLCYFLHRSFLRPNRAERIVAKWPGLQAWDGTRNWHVSRRTRRFDETRRCVGI